jgi:hypothetical protein
VLLITATLEAGCGIVTDRKGRQPERQLNIMALETLEELRAAGLRTGPGEMGEQIVVSDFAGIALRCLRGRGNCPDPDRATQGAPPGQLPTTTRGDRTS